MGLMGLNHMNDDATQAARSGPSFGQLPLSEAMQANLQTLGYVAMTPIQAASLPLALAGKDLIAQAKTGSGKTVAFGLPLLARLNPRFFGVQALVLCPTRELADQVPTEIRRLARAEDNIKVVTLCGGVPLRGQLATLEHGAHIVVGTPGRVMDHMRAVYLRVRRGCVRARQLFYKRLNTRCIFFSTLSKSFNGKDILIA